MIKENISLLLAIVISASCVSYSRPEQQEVSEDAQLSQSQMKTICELATMECYYHNVEKSREKDAQGFLWWKSDKVLWMEYTGTVKLGIDVSLVKMEVDGDVVTITIPEAKVLSIDVDDLADESFIRDPGSGKIDAETQTNALKAAQDNMGQTASEDAALLTGAQQRAQNLLEDYVTNIGDAVGREYTIKWIYLSADGRTTRDMATTITSEEEDTEEE